MQTETKISGIKKREDFPYGAIELTDACMQRAIRLELQYLKSLEPDRLLAGFLETAGCPQKAKRYEGWEVTEIQGHTLGHYLSAVSQAYGYTKEKELLERIRYITKELQRVQREDGYLFAWKEEIFDRIEKNQPAWVPWYTMHKIVSGLLSAYRYAGDKTALDTAERLGAWIYNRCIGWTQETKNIVLSVEYGGMNDCLYELYEITGDNRFLQAGHQFDENSLFEPIHQGKDILNGRHANTTIPKILGALKRYTVSGKAEIFYLEMAQSFWDMVVEHHTYVTGGNSEWEHFGRPDILDGERTACNCETCNTYNMLKLSKLLYEITGEHKYADYYANTSLNAILSSQNPETGMTMYFQPMATGYFKVYSTPFDSFWCCTGSGMENFTKLHEGIYYHSKENLYVSRYVSSRLHWKEQGLKLQMECGPEEEEFRVYLKVNQADKQEAVQKIHFLIPDWANQTAALSFNGERIAKGGQETGSFLVEKPFQAGDEIRIAFPMRLKAKVLQDNPNAIAFVYGPYVLSAGLGKAMMDTTCTGVDVLVPEKEIAIRDYFVLDDITIEELKEHPEKYLIQKKGEAVFSYTNLGEEYVFTPHYKRYQERYGIYWLIYERGSKHLEDIRQTQERRRRLKRLQTDVIPVGNDQYELAHGIKGEKTDCVQVDGHPGRYCREEGWFSYRMEITGEEQCLCMTVSEKDAGSIFEVYAGDRLIREVHIETGKGPFYLVECSLPKECSLPNNNRRSKDNKITIRVQHKAGACRIFDELYLKKLTL